MIYVTIEYFLSKTAHQFVIMQVLCFPMERYIKLQQYNYSVFPSCPDHAQHFPVVQPLTLPLNSCFFLQCSGDCLVKNKRFQSLKDYSLLLLLYNVVFFLLVMSCLYCFDGVTYMKLIFAPSWTFSVSHCPF